MNFKALLFSGLALMSFSAYNHASDCEPNNMGGQFCVNDDGTASDSMPNEVSGQDTYSSDGKWSSTVPDGAGTNEAIDGTTLLPDDDTISSPSSRKSDSSLMGRDWNSASNIQTDGAATSSAAMANSP